ncbi:hypothetical protein JFV28_17170, partial [Pseudomonas sp. TH05]|nr:hypothetical protein [Pseudomonas sp. TH05]
MRTFKTIPERGDFGFQQLVGPHKVSGASMSAERGFFGLHLSKSSPFGSVRDEQGNIYSFVRSLMAPNGTPNPTKFFYLNNHVDQVNLRMDHEKMAR